MSLLKIHLEFWTLNEWMGPIWTTVDKFFSVCYYTPNELESGWNAEAAVHDWRRIYIKDIIASTYCRFRIRHRRSVDVLDALTYEVLAVVWGGGSSIKGSLRGWHDGWLVRRIRICIIFWLFIHCGRWDTTHSNSKCILCNFLHWMSSRNEVQTRYHRLLIFHFLVNVGGEKKRSLFPQFKDYGLWE